jgi:hypothetical protein
MHVDDTADNTCPALLHPAPQLSPRHRTPFDLRHEGSGCVSMTWRVTPARPYRIQRHGRHRVIRPVRLHQCLCHGVPQMHRPVPRSRRAVPPVHSGLADVAFNVIQRVWSPNLWS